jgi:phage shock protein E
MFTNIHAQEINQVSSTETVKLIQADSKLIILDVRTAEEFNAGHIKGAINIDIKLSDAFVKIDKLDRNAKYLVHCRTNHRSKVAVDHMVENNFKNLFQMSDGFMGWSQSMLPVEN